MAASKAAGPQWRPMAAADLAAVAAVAEVVHPNYPEDPAVAAERLALHPAGCLVLREEAGGRLLGYGVSHPWRRDDAPPLNSLLGALPASPETYYIHDIALLPEARGLGAGAAVVDILSNHARTLGLPSLSLVAVNNSGGYWVRQGFVRAEGPEWTHKLASYGADAAFMIQYLICYGP